MGAGTGGLYFYRTIKIVLLNCKKAVKKSGKIFEIFEKQFRFTTLFSPISEGVIPLIAKQIT